MAHLPPQRRRLAISPCWRSAWQDGHRSHLSTVAATSLFVQPCDTPPPPFVMNVPGCITTSERICPRYYGCQIRLMQRWMLADIFSQRRLLIKPFLCLVTLTHACARIAQQWRAHRTQTHTYDLFKAKAAGAPCFVVVG